MFSKKPVSAAASAIAAPTLLRLKVHPDSKKAVLPRKSSDAYEIRVRAPAERGLANQEALAALEAPPMKRQTRIVSLIASATEIVCALGLEDALVGVSHECDFPSTVRRLPRCSSPGIPTKAPSRVIHESLLARLRRSISVYEVDAALIERLRPDVIITQDQCEVCAVSLRDLEKAACALFSSRPKIVSLNAPDLNGLFADIRKVGLACGVKERGETLADSLRAQFSRRAYEAGVAAAREGRPTVACIEWIEPLMSAGNWMPELVELAGGRSVFGAPGRHSPWLRWEDVRAADPEVLLVSPCGFRTAQTLKELRLLRALPGWKALRAVRAKRVHAADGNSYFHRPGPRLLDSLDILREMLHPLSFPKKRRPANWIRLA